MAVTGEEADLQRLPGYPMNFDAELDVVIPVLQGVKAIVEVPKSAIFGDH